MPAYNYGTSDDPKMLRETLCLAQNRLLNSPYASDRNEWHAKVLQRLINDCDRQRPLGYDGKHGSRHTPTCGCDISESISND